MSDVPQLTRRRFLIGGAAVAAMPAVGGGAWMLARSRDQAVGFVEHSSDLDPAAWLAEPGGRVIPARRLGSGDRALDSVDVRILGIVGADDGPVAVDVLTRVENRWLPFSAWSRGAWGTSSPMRFTAAVAQEGLRLRVTSDGLDGEEPEARDVVISAGWGSAAGLVQGTYLVGLDPESWATPRTVRSLGDLPPSLVVAVRPG